MADEMKIVFDTHLSELTEGIHTIVCQWLEESASELQSDVVKLSRRDTSQTAASYGHVVDTARLEAYVGSNLENAIWEEFGTGEYALNGDGRKGWWVYVKNGDPAMKGTGRKSYTYEEAKKAVAFLRAKGLDAHMTRGKRPNRPIFRAFTEGKSKISKGFAYKLKALEKT